MHKIRTRYGSIAYEEAGAGLPVVLLHANAGDHHSFDSIVPALSARYRTIAIDLPGFGQSDPCDSPGATTGLYMADVLAELVAELSLERAVFIGNSVGGFAAARLAVARPALVLALILVDTGGFTAPTAFNRLFCRVKGSRRMTRLVDTLFASWYLKRRNPFVTAIIARTDEYRRDPARVAVNAALWRSFARPGNDLRQPAPQIQAPTLLVWGRHDPVLPLADARTAQSLIPHARLVVLDTGHMPFAEDPHGFLATITPFMQALPSQELLENDYAASHA